MLVTLGALDAAVWGDWRLLALAALTAAAGVLAAAAAGVLAGYALDPRRPTGRHRRTDRPGGPC